ncbi:hypothetical protein ABTE42_20915, partial [Acinetobacter baumannii]
KRRFFLIMDCALVLSVGFDALATTNQTSITLACGKSYSPQPISGTSRSLDGSDIDISLKVTASRNIERMPMSSRPHLLKADFYNDS